MQSKLRDNDKDDAARLTQVDPSGRGGSMAKVTRVKSGVEKDGLPTLPTLGMSRWNSLRHFVPISRESWRKLVIAGRAPKAVKLSERCTMYSNVEVHRWLADPAGYKA